MSTKNKTEDHVLTLKEKKELINQAYIPVTLIKPKLYKSKGKRNKLEDIAISSSSRHANSTENIRENMIMRALNQPLDTLDSNECLRIETEANESKLLSPGMSKLKPSTGMNIELDITSNSGDNITSHMGVQFPSSANNKSVKEMTPIEYYWLQKTKRFMTQQSSPGSSAAVTTSPKPTSHNNKVSTPEGIRAQRERKTLEKLAKQIQEAEKKKAIQDMIDHKFIIPMEDPIDVQFSLKVLCPQIIL